MGYLIQRKEVFEAAIVSYEQYKVKRYLSLSRL